jgi:hypothetical protein
MESRVGFEHHGTVLEPVVASLTANAGTSLGDGGVPETVAV